MAISLLFVGGQVFISYVHGSDDGYVASLAAHLVDAGVSVWYDKEIITGDRWERRIRNQIDTCAAFMVVMTPEAQESEWVAREIIWAEKTRKPIFPLLLRGEVLFQLGNVQYDDVTDGHLPGETFTRRLQVLAARHAALR